MTKLSEYIKVNDGFKNAINLYLNLNKADKILSYIPTKSSVTILNEYLEAVDKNIEQATILIGPYGKGKSHLLLVLLAVLTMKRSLENGEIIKRLLTAINKVDEHTAKNIEQIWNNKKRMLPVIISSSQTDLNQAFLVALNEALKRDGLEELSPDTYFSRALENISNWKHNFKETYSKYKDELHSRNINMKEFELGIKQCNKENLKVFREIYPKLTSGSQFNPMINSAIIPLFKNICSILCEEYDYDGIYIVFDEFSKFIESKDKTAAGSDMELLQSICELAQESKSQQIFITLVAHKSIKEYGNYLSTDIINSFTGIEGRITEKYFITSSKNNYELIQNAIIKNEDKIDSIPEIKKNIDRTIALKYYENMPLFNSIFDFNDFYKKVVRGCYPLNPISSYMLLNISEKVAQNERTLFTFISKNEPNSMARYIARHNDKMGWLIGADIIYDYFKNIFKKDITKVYIHDEWLKAEYAISKSSDEDQVKVIKALALINIINKPEELPAEKRILSDAVSVKSINETLEQLVSKQLIYLKSSTGKYAFKTIIGADLKREIKNRRLLKGNDANISKVLARVTGYDYVIPKKYNQINAMTRYFRYEFITYESFYSVNNADTFFNKDEFCDGKVIALVEFNEKRSNKQDIIKKLSELACEKLVVIKPSNCFQMIKQVQDYEIIQNLKVDKEFIDNNSVLLKELEVFEEDISFELCKFVEKSYSPNSGSIAYRYTNGEIKEFKKYDINKLVSNICDEYYHLTPVINNELINKQVISSSPIKNAMKKIIDYLLSCSEDKSFYEEKTSPEATIFRALFVKTKLISGDADKKMKHVIEVIDNFLSQCERGRCQASVVIKELTEAPIGIRKGVIPIYLAYCISKRKGDVIAYLGNKEFELTTDILLNLCEHESDYCLFISTENAEKEQYINDLREMFMLDSGFSNNGSRLKNILISMQRWYRSLPQFTRNFKTQREFISDRRMFDAILRIRVLLQKVDANPYEIIFEKIPKELDTVGDYKDTIEQLELVKKILEQHLDSTLAILAERTKEIFDNKSKEDLYHTLKQWYERQSEMSKKGVFGTKVTEMMSFISGLRIYNDNEIVRKLARILTDVYVENWFDSSEDSYIESLIAVKKEIESIKDDNNNEVGKCFVSFINSKGCEVKRFYDRASENSGTIMRNLIEDTLESYRDSVSANDRVAILVEMLEKVLE